MVECSGKCSDIGPDIASTFFKETVDLNQFLSSVLFYFFHYSEGHGVGGKSCLPFFTGLLQGLH